jgi:hypothetical protein
VLRKVVGIVPAREHAARRRLLDACEEAFGVRFQGRAIDECAGLDAVLVLPAAAADAARLPAALPRLVAVAEESPGRAPASVVPLDLATVAPLDRRLRGAQLHEDAIGPTAPLPTVPGDVVLATRGAGPVWLARPAAGATTHVVTATPAELGEDECLRDRLRDGRFLAVAALTQFLRLVCDGPGHRPGPVRACVLFDDPNLHWTSYGHVRYADLVRHADAHGYHAAFATVPLDGWFAHPRATRLFRERPDRLSLIVHGNDHTRLELARPAGPAARRAMLAQALRRVAAFERRSGVPVARIMAAPFGRCSEEVARELVPLGFEGLCISRPYPWIAYGDRPWLARPAGTSALAGWHPASVVAGGLPVLLRQAFSASAQDLALRAFLDQPLIVYGHHDDLRDGLDRLAELAATVGRLGPVRWQSVGELAAGNVQTRRDGDVLHARLLSRRTRVPVPDGVRRLEVALGALDGSHEDDIVAWHAGRAHGTVTPGAGPVRIPDGATAVTVHLRRCGATDPAAVPAPPRSHRALARRLATEGRDRLTAVSPATAGILLRAARVRAGRPAADTAR